MIQCKCGNSELKVDNYSFSIDMEVITITFICDCGEEIMVDYEAIDPEPSVE